MDIMDEYTFYEGLDQHGLYPIRIPYRGIPYTCDIFIVHGLNGGTHRSFNHPTSNNVWFRDFLPDQVFDQANRTNGRIWAYGYNAEFAFQNAGNTGAHDLANELLEAVLHARKKKQNIIFICHSLGGIIVKNALVQASLQERYSDIPQSTIGVIFVGTPHRGTSVANMGDIAQRVGKAVLPGYQPNRLIIQNLKKNCDSLYQSADNFGNISKRLKIYSFYETVGSIVVQKESAIMHLPNEVPLPLNAPHRDMCKFRDRTDPEYMKIRRSIQELMALTSPIGQKAPHQNPSLHPINQQYSESNPNDTPQHGPRYQPNSAVLRTAPAATYTPWRQHYQPGPTPVPTFGDYSKPHDMSGPVNSRFNDRANLDHSTKLNPFNMRSFSQAPQPPPLPRKQVISDADTRREEEEFQRAIELSKQEQARKEQAIKDDARQEEARKEEARQERLRQDQAKLEQINKEQARLEELREAQARLERTRQEQARYNASLASLASLAPPSTYAVRNRATSQPPPPKQEEYRPTASVTSRPVSSAPAVPMTVPNSTLEEEEESKWMCDACMGHFAFDRPHIVCVECDDYDLCSLCYQNDRVSKSHQRTHEVRRIKATYDLTITDLIPAEENVNPEQSFGATNWTIEQGDVRWLYLRETNHHARFMAVGLAEGHHHIELALAMRLSSKLTQAGIQQLAGSPLCKLTVHVGWPRDRKTFAHTRFVENESLAEKVFSESTKREVELGPNTPTIFKIPLNGATFHMDDDDQNNKQLGVLLQWEDVRSFTNSDDAIVQIALVNVRLQDLVDWKTAPKSSSADDEVGSSAGAILGGLLLGAMVQQAREEQEEEDRNKRIMAAIRQEQLRREALARQAQEQEEMKKLAQLMLLGAMLNG